MNRRNEITLEYIEILESLKAFKKRHKLTFEELGKLFSCDKSSLVLIFGKSRIVTLDKLNDFIRMTEFYDFAHQEEKKERHLKIDYLDVRLPGMTANQVIEKILQVSDKHMEDVGGLYGFSNRVKFIGRDDVHILYNGDRDTLNCILHLSGSGCRWFEKILKYESINDWKDFLCKCYDPYAKTNFLRLDLAMDDCDGTLDIPSIIDDIKQQRYVSRFKSFSVETSQKEIVKNSPIVAYTQYCGGKRSEVRFCIYEKAKELFFKHKISAPELSESINRFEIRYLRSKAQAAVRELLCGESFIDMFYGTIDIYLYLPKNRSFQRFCDYKNSEICLKSVPKDWDIISALRQAAKQYGSLIETTKRYDPKLVKEIFKGYKTNKKVAGYYNSLKGNN